MGTFELGMAKYLLVLLLSPAFASGRNFIRQFVMSNDGCDHPGWPVSYSMADSLYMYCYEPCPIDWLANNTQHGVFGGVVGYDHYYTHQGMLCLDGELDAYGAATITVVLRWATRAP